MFIILWNGHQTVPFFGGFSRYALWSAHNIRQRAPSSTVILTHNIAKQIKDILLGTGGFSTPAA
jgi:hypothetical protein